MSIPPNGYSQQLAVAQSQVTDIKKELDANKKEIEKSNQDLRQFDQQLISIQTTIDTLAKQVDAARLTEEKAKSSVESATAELAKTQESLSALDGQISTSEQAVNSLLNAIQLIQHEIQSQTTEKNGLQGELTKLNSDITSTDGKLQAGQLRLQDSEQGIKDAQSALSLAKQSVTQFSSQLQDSENKLSDVQSAIRSLQAPDKGDDKFYTEEEIEEEKTRTKADGTKEKYTVTKKVRKFNASAYNSAMSDYIETKRNLELSRRSIESTIKTLQDKLAAAKLSVTQSELNLTKAQKERDESLQNLRDLRELKKMQLQQRSDLTQKIKTIEATITSLQGKKSDFNGKLNKERMGLEKLRKDKTVLSGTYNNKREDLKFVNLAYTSAKSQTQSQLQKFQEANSKFTEIDRQKVNLEFDLSLLKEKNLSLTVKLKEAEKHLDELNTKAREAQGNANPNIPPNPNTSAANDINQSVIEQYETQAKQYGDQRSVLFQRSSDYQTQLQKAIKDGNKAEIDRLRKLIEKTNKQMQDAEINQGTAYSHMAAAQNGTYTEDLVHLIQEVARINEVMDKPISDRIQEFSSSDIRMMELLDSYYPNVKKTNPNEVAVKNNTAFQKAFDEIEKELKRLGISNPMSVTPQTIKALADKGVDITQLEDYIQDRRLQSMASREYQVIAGLSAYDDTALQAIEDNGVTIKLEDISNPGHAGYYYPGQKTIIVDKDMVGSGIADVTVHEIGHYIDDEMGLKNIGIPYNSTQEYHDRMTQDFIVALGGNPNSSDPQGELLRVASDAGIQNDIGAIDSSRHVWTIAQSELQPAMDKLATLPAFQGVSENDRFQFLQRYYEYVQTGGRAPVESFAEMAVYTEMGSPEGETTWETLFPRSTVYVDTAINYETVP